MNYCKNIYLKVGMLYFDLGHVSLLEQVINDDLIQVYDPGPDAPGKKNVRISDMYDAMRKKGGLYIFG
mgnify:CR=1 FL=1